MEFELSWSDEFDGTELDTNKWDYRLSMMGMRWPAWTDKGVHLDDKGNAVFTLLEEDGRPVCSQLQTGSEVDVMESFKPGNVVAHNVFTGGYGLDMKRIKVGGEMDLEHPEEYHRFGVLWEPTGYTFYVDGVEDGRITENVSGCPQFILISTEPRGYRFDDHQPIREAYEAVGDTFMVDYVRIFDRVDV